VLFVLEDADLQTEWCSRERLHLELERYSMPEWKENCHETEALDCLGI
jgi:hypothetical protein